MKKERVERDYLGDVVYGFVIDKKASGVRRFRWYRKRDEVMQWIWHPVSNEMGYGEGYWRKAGKKDSAKVRTTLHEQSPV
jgi:hypothetical protein